MKKLSILAATILTLHGGISLAGEYYGAGSTLHPSQDYINRQNAYQNQRGQYYYRPATGNSYSLQNNGQMQYGGSQFSASPDRTLRAIGMPPQPTTLSPKAVDQITPIVKCGVKLGGTAIAARGSPAAGTALAVGMVNDCFLD